MIVINEDLEIPEAEIELSAVRSRGPGGQNVNKVSTAVRLRFDVRASNTLPPTAKERLLGMRDHRISTTGVINIKAQRSRSREKNRTDAMHRFAELVRQALVDEKPRKKTRPGRKAKQKRLADKAHRGRLKQSRGKVVD